MADTVEPTETVQEPLPSEVTPSAPTQDNAAAIAAAEKARQQAEMERNLLRKRLEALEKEKTEKQQQELKDKEDWKTLAEQAVARAEALEQERAQESQAQAAKTATETVYTQFDPKVVEIAKTAGISASDDSDEALETLRAKLEAIKEKVGPTGQATPTPNNPTERVVVEDTPSYVNLNRDALAFKPDIDEKAGIVWKNNRAAKVQLKNSSAIAAMKQMSGLERQEV